MGKAEHRQAILNVLKESGVPFGKSRDDADCIRLHPISADGSLRRFYRIEDQENSIGVAVFPGKNKGSDHREAIAAIHIGKHLYAKGAAVPKIIGADMESGLILYEDCGDLRLDSCVNHNHGKVPVSHDEIIALYKDVIQHLVFMQVQGGIDFDIRWCWDTPHYDRNLMIERESLYFLNSFWYDYVEGYQVKGIQNEFNEIARRAETNSDQVFLHRDFQSRNILVHRGEIKIIDFQGGRIGPPGYDLASLLLDPYADLPLAMQEELQGIYVRELGKLTPVDEMSFAKHYIYLRLQRNLQIIGAFSFLFNQRNKTFFKQFIGPALRELDRLLCEEARDFPILRKLVKDGVTRINSITC